MTPIMKPLKLAEQWKKKCFEFSVQSDDNLVPVISKVIDTLAFYLKDSAHPRLQPALKTLEYERSIHLSEETSDVLSIRIMMYGLIQSVHGLLLAKTVFNDSNSSEAKTIQAMIGDWKVKCCVLSNESNDILLPVVEKVLYAIVVLLKGADQSCIQTTLKALEYELTVCKFSENAEEPSIRTLMYGVIECVHGCLLDMTALKNSIPSEEILKDKVADEHVMNVNKQMKKEKSIGVELDGFSTIPDFTVPPVVPKEEESIDPSPVIPDDNQIPVFTLPPKKEPKEEIDNAEQINSIDDNRKFDDEDMMNGDMNVGMDNGFHGFPLDEEKEEEVDVNHNNLSVVPKAEKRSSRRTSKPINYVGEDEDSDEEEESSMKKSKSESREKDGKKRRYVNGDSESEPDNKKSRVYKRSDMEMDCPECTFRSNYARAWISHLRNKHSTTPALAGLALRCDCGHEGVSYVHSWKCEVANFTVIRKRNGPIRRLEDVKETPQCILCEVYPKTALGFVRHLTSQHHSTLRASGIELLCDCGLLATSIYSFGKSHTKQCDGLKFSLQKTSNE